MSNLPSIQRWTPQQRNERFDSIVDGLLAREKCGTLARLLKRTGGMKRFWAEPGVAEHLLRGFEGVEYDVRYEPQMALYERAFYRCCAQQGIEIPFRTERLQTTSERRHESAGRPCIPMRRNASP